MWHEAISDLGIELELEAVVAAHRQRIETNRAPRLLRLVGYMITAKPKHAAAASTKTIARQTSEVSPKFATFLRATCMRRVCKKSLHNASARILASALTMAHRDM